MPLVLVHEDVLDFHEAFDLPRPTELVREPDPDLVDLRIRLISEEVNDELIVALLQYKNSPDSEHIANVADAIVDSVYVLVGAAITFGIPFDAVWQEVQQANMAKLGADGKPIRRADGKVLKPEGWQPPDIFGVLGLKEPPAVDPNVSDHPGVPEDDYEQREGRREIVEVSGVDDRRVRTYPFEEATFVFKGTVDERREQVEVLEGQGWRTREDLILDYLLKPDNGVELRVPFRRSVAHSNILRKYK